MLWSRNVFIFKAFLALIAFPVQAFDMGRHYSDTRGWEVRMSQNTGCIATSPIGSDIATMMVLVPAGNFELVLPTAAPSGAEIPVTLDIDRYSFTDSFYAEDGFAHGVFDTPLREAMAKGRNMTILHDGESFFLPLEGTTAALLKLQECWYDLVQPSANTSRELPVALPSRGDKTSAAPAVAATQSVKACPAPGSVASPDVQDWGDITFENRSGVPLTIYWLDWNGQPQNMGTLEVGQNTAITSRASHLFLATDAFGFCHGGVIEVPLGQSTHIIR